MATTFSWDLVPSSPTPASSSSSSSTPRVIGDLALDDDGDLLLEGGDLVLLEGSAQILSDLKARLSTFRGEWFLDQSVGLPYFDEILVKRPDLVAIKALFRDKILSVPGVAELTQLDLDYVGSTRTLTVKFKATTDLGELIADTVEVGL